MGKANEILITLDDKQLFDITHEYFKRRGLKFTGWGRSEYPNEHVAQLWYYDLDDIFDNQDEEELE